MPRDQNGIYSLPAGYKAVSGQKVLASQHNPPLEDLASSMTNSLPRTGVAPMTAALPMGGNPVTGMADGSDDTDGATVGQVASVFGAKTNAAPEKTTPIDDDYVPLYDSAVSNVLKKLKWSSIKAALKTYLDTIYAPIGFVADLASTAAGKGASKVGVQDSGGNFTGTTVEAVLSELYGLLLGVGQTWQDVTASRTAGTSYQNTTGRSIEVVILARSSVSAERTMQVSSNGATWIDVGVFPGVGSQRNGASAVIPNNWYYRASGALDGISQWSELR
jgi:hypothetical protein